MGPRVGEPVISPDGKIMYLGNKHMERTDGGWLEVRGLGSPFKDIPIMDHSSIAGSRGELPLASLIYKLNI